MLARNTVNRHDVPRLRGWMLAAVLSLVAVNAAAASEWVSDPSRSRLGFESTYDGQPVRGQFREWTAQVLLDEANLEGSRLTVSIDTASVETDVEEQSAALLGSEWLSTRMFPKATFSSRSIRRGAAPDAYVADGELTLRGVRKPVSITFTAVQRESRPGIAGTANIDRSDFGVGSGPWSSTALIPAQVTVSFELVAASSGTQAAAAAVPAATGPAASSTVAPAAANPPATAAPPSAEEYVPTPAFRNQTRAPAPREASEFQVEVLASGLVQPWSLAFLPDGKMLVTERPGRLRVVSKDGQLSPPLAGVPTVKAIAAQGLHDVVLDPDFARNRTLYLTYYAPLANDVPPTLEAWVNWVKLPAGEHEKQPFGTERVARARLSADERTLEDLEVIHEGGDRRLVFAPDGSLFVAASPPAAGGTPVDEEPQRLENAYGKILRIRPDGSIPADNPFVGRPGVRSDIFAYGLRDVEGAAINPRTGELWTIEHGPRGGDELNRVLAGRNYGFPLISYGREYSGELINGGRTAAEGLEQPRYFWTPSIAPSGLLFYTGDLFPEWKNSVFVGAMAGRRLIRLELQGDTVVAEEPMLVERGKRIRDIRQGPDGAVYVLTAEAAGELLKLTPRP